ncbi:MAG: redox-sensing transcriptional repressor Rex [Clostridia bacterium]|nr:redox-sensing transcriptional repressor Rex [Clostridia bacterium]
MFIVKKGKPSDAVIKRIPRYYRLLKMMAENGEESVSSSVLGERLGLTASQVRQDFNCFGGYGQQGYGYNVKKLLAEICSILAVDEEHTAVIVGAGNIGKAITRFEGMAKENIKIKALFDINPDIIGTEIAERPVYDINELESYIAENNIDIGIIAARKSVAQELADKMVKSGVKGIWNFAPVEITADVPVENVHFLDSIITLTYKMKAQSEE